MVRAIYCSQKSFWDFRFTFWLVVATFFTRRCNLAAYYWFKASTAKVTDKDMRYDPRFDFVVNDPEGKGRDTNILATVLEQSRLNRIAAIYTALAILFQAAASSPLIESWIRR
jgi:hypothetical protein